MSNVEQQLKQQISAGRIIFDSGAADRLEKELFRENDGTRVSTSLQSLVLKLSQLVNTHIRVSSLVRSSQGHHGEGRAVDLGNEEIAGLLLPQVATTAQISELRIDELIFDASVARKYNRNEWNYDQGRKHNYDEATLNQHKDHIHFSVKI
jgi:hypothetical protein